MSTLISTVNSPLSVSLFGQTSLQSLLAISPLDDYSENSPLSKFLKKDFVFGASAGLKLGFVNDHAFGAWLIDKFRPRTRTSSPQERASGDKNKILFQKFAQSKTH